MPVEFPADDEATAYGRYAKTPSQAELEKVFFHDDGDRALIGRRRGPCVTLGFALQLVTIRYVGTFPADPLDVPTEVLDFVAGQLGIEDPSYVKRCFERKKTRFDHTWDMGTGISRTVPTQSPGLVSVELCPADAAHRLPSGT